MPANFSHHNVMRTDKDHTRLQQKTAEIIVELKALHLWQKAEAYEMASGEFASVAAGPIALAGWLQFVHLPTISTPNFSILPTLKATYIAPRAAQCLRGISRYQHLLQLLVELDGLV